MERLGMLIDYEWCSGCHSCEIACQMEHGLPVGQTGILVKEIGPWEIAEDTWQLTNIAVPTDQCSGCLERLGQGKMASCAHHCQARCLQVASLEELMGQLDVKAKQSLFVLL